jgi:hypothetical protein
MLKNYNLLLIREEVVETHNGNTMHTKIELKLPEKQNEGQSAVELLSTYAWAFIIVSILVVTVGRLLLHRLQTRSLIKCL